MKYLKTLNVWDSSIQQAIISGQIKLQRGQWLTCGVNNNKKCRYVSHNKNGLRVVHWQGNSKATTAKFIKEINFINKLK